MNFLHWYFTTVFVYPAVTEADAWVNICLLIGHMALCIAPFHVIGAIRESRALASIQDGTGPLHYIDSRGRIHVNIYKLLKEPKVIAQIEACRSIPIGR